MKKIEGAALGLATTLLFACGGSDFSAADTHPGAAGMASVAGSGGTAGAGVGGSAGSAMAGAGTGGSYEGPPWIEAQTGKITMRGLTGTLADYTVDFEIDSWGDSHSLLVDMKRNGSYLGQANNTGGDLFPLSYSAADGIASVSLSFARKPCDPEDPTCGIGLPTLDVVASDLITLSLSWCPASGGMCSGDVNVLSATLYHDGDSVADWSN